MLGYKNWKCKSTECIFFNKLFSDCHLTHEIESKNKIAGTSGGHVDPPEKFYLSHVSLLASHNYVKKHDNNMNILPQQAKT